MEQPGSPGRDTQSTRIFECQECGRRYALELPSSDLTARCERCGATLLSVPANSLQRSLALTITGLVLVFVANTMPFMSLNIKGRFQQVNLITGDVALFDQGLWPLAALVLLTTVLAPTLTLGAIAYVLLGLRLPRPPPGLPVVFRWLERLRPWSMIEVYLLGVFVAYVKLIAFARIEVGAACYALAFLMLVMVMIDSALSRELVWREMEKRGLVKAPPAPDWRRVGKECR